MNFDNLKTMDVNQLREVAGKQGLQVHPRAGKDNIIKKIMEATLTPQQKPQTVDTPHPAEKPKKPVDNNTKEQVEAAIADIKARVPQFEAIYNDEENTVHFRCKGAEECLNLAIPIRVIKMKAQNVARGKLSLIGLTEHFDKSIAGGNSAYTNTVLAV